MMTRPLPDSLAACPHRAVVREIIAIRPEIRIIKLAPGAPFEFEAGQYVFASFGGHAPRPYSLASAPGGLLEIHIKRGTGPASRYATDNLECGHNVALSPAMGESVLNDGETAPVLALAGGLGIAPLKAIAEQALRRAVPPPSMKLLWTVENQADLYLDDYFHALAASHPAFTYRPVAGQLMTAALDGQDEDIAGFRIFVSGPPAMIAAVVPLLRARGVPEEKISYDRHP